MTRYYYNTKETLLRVIWTIVEPVFFRFSPRLFYGWRNFILRRMGARIGESVQIFPSVRISFPWLLEVGDRSVIAWDVKIYNLGKISIGHDTVISQYSHLCGGTHDFEDERFTLLRKGLTVGNHVWIAADAFIGPGVMVHDGAVVGARSVVVDDIEPMTLAAGNPAVAKRKLKTIGMKYAPYWHQDKGQG